MSAKQNHSIKKYRIELNLGSEKTAFKTQQRFLSAAKKMACNELEDIFDEVVGDSRYLKINKLEIDVGTINETALEETLRGRLLPLIEEELRKSLSASSHSTASDFVYKKMKPHHASNAEVLETPQYLFSCLTYFLKSGRFPWWAPKIDFNDFEREIIQIFHEKPKGLSERLKKVLKQSENAVERLSLQFSENFLVEVISLLSSGRRELVRETLLGLKTLFREEKTSMSPGRLRKRVYPPIFKVLSSLSHEINSSQDWLKPTIYHFQHCQKEASHAEVLRRLFVYFQNVKDANLRNEMTQVIHLLAGEDSTTESTQTTWRDADHRERHFPTEKKIKTDTLNPDSPVIKEKGIHFSEKKSKDISGEEDLDYYINNSGLVIVAPFFSSFFKELQLLKGKDFKNDEARHRAVHILQYIIHKTESASETELTLNKILCGMPVEEPIERDLQLRDEDKTGVKDLLNSVIKHWAVLKGTSADGLREGFLQREGKLSIEENGWKLIVERKTMDILLSKIPWGVSMIKLPWMDSFVFVEW